MLGDGLKIIETPLFPKECKRAHDRRFTLLVGVGANIKNPLRNFKRLFFLLSKDKYFSLYFTGCILKNPPFGYKDQPYFFNTTITLGTNMTPQKALDRLLWIEKRFGRKRSFKNAPRELDLDIILFENFIMYNKKITLPHPEYKKRASVLVPMTFNRRKLRWKK